MLNYEIINPQTNKSQWILFIAGYTGTLETWKNCCNELNMIRKMPILLVDNIGSGKSEQPPGPYSIEFMANKVIEVIHKLELVELNIVGHSLGGAIAQFIAIYRPDLVSRLILVSSFSKLDSKCRYFLTGRFELLKNNVSKDLIALNSISSLFSNQYLDDKTKVDFSIGRTINNPQNIDGMYGQLTACLSHDTNDLLHNIKSQTTIISGDEDILVSPEHSNILHSKIANSDLLIVSNAAHMIQLDTPAELAKIIYNQF